MHFDELSSRNMLQQSSGKRVRDTLLLQSAALLQSRPSAGRPSFGVGPLVVSGVKESNRSDWFWFLQRAGLLRQAATVVAVAMCAYAVCSIYSGSSPARSAVELVQKSHTKHMIHAAKTSMSVS